MHPRRSVFLVLHRYRGVTRALLLLVSLFLVSCSLINTSDNQVVIKRSNDDIVLTDTEILRYLDEWENARPSIHRLSELDEDLQLLINEVSRIALLEQAPEQLLRHDQDSINASDVVQVNPYSEEVTSEWATTAEPTQTPAKTSSQATTQAVEAELVQPQGYAIHLASFMREQNAEFGWFVIRNEFPELLAGLTPKVSAVVRSNQQLFSLKVGPFTQAAHAEAICQRLKHRNYRCSLTDFSGQVLQTRPFGS